MASLIDLNYIKDKCSRKFYDYFNRLLLYKRKLSRKQIDLTLIDRNCNFLGEVNLSFLTNRV